MKVNFDATFEEFVDVYKRSQSTSLSSYIVLICSIVGCSAAIAVLVHWIFQSWPTTILAALAGCASGGYALIGSQDKHIRNHLKKQIGDNASFPTEVEITEEGVSTRCLGHTVVQEWSTIEQIEETDDAIYFRNKFGAYCSARKRGFRTEEEMKEFLNRARLLCPQSLAPEHTIDGVETGKG